MPSLKGAALGSCPSLRCNSLKWLGQLGNRSTTMGGHERATLCPAPVEAGAVLLMFVPVSIVAAAVETVEAVTVIGVAVLIITVPVRVAICAYVTSGTVLSVTMDSVLIFDSGDALPAARSAALESDDEARWSLRCTDARGATGGGEAREAPDSGEARGAPGCGEARGALTCGEARGVPRGEARGAWLSGVEAAATANDVVPGDPMLRCSSAAITSTRSR